MIPRLPFDRERPTALELGTGVGPGALFLAAHGFRVHAVLDADRQAVFRAVKARLDPRGYYLLSAAMYDAARHRPEGQVVDRGTGRVFDGYDEDCLYEPDTDLCYWPYDGDVDIDAAITVDETGFFPARRYRDCPRLRKEVESYGFEVLLQTGEWGENQVAVHRGSEIRPYRPRVHDMIPSTGVLADGPMDPVRLRRD